MEMDVLKTHKTVIEIRESIDTITLLASKAVKSVHPIVEAIISSLSKIDIIKIIKIEPDFIQASSEFKGDRAKKPITEPGHPTATGISLIVETDLKSVQFYEITSAKKGYGEQMVATVLNALPDDWDAMISMDYSDGFWDKMIIRYPKLEFL